MNTEKQIHLSAVVPESLSGKRLDQVLAQLFPDYSRSRLQAWIKSQQISVDGAFLKAKDKVFAEQGIDVSATLSEETSAKPQPLALDILFEDDDILVINKPVGLVVHPGAGNPNSTLMNALLHHCPAAINIPRAGIVHRLDKDTSGLLVVAKSLPAHTALVKQLQDRTVKRIYLAVVNGALISGGTVDEPIGRHPKQRIKMAVIEEGKPAITHYRVYERFHAHTAIKVSLETGRTHQIRVHMAHIHHALVGDQTYGGRLKFPANTSEAYKETLRNFKRQALHAWELSLIHPVSGEEITFAAPIPEDLQQLMRELKKEK